VTTLKLDGTPGSSALDALEPHIPAIYADPGRHVMAIVEWRHVERVQPAPGTDKEPSVKVKMVSCEIPIGEQVDAVRSAQRALYLRRTAQGTLTEQLDVEMTERTLERLGGELAYADSVRLQAGVHAFARYAEDACSRARPTIGELRADLKAIRDGLRALSTGVEPAAKEKR
jgi:hypothetical protein